MLKFKKEEAVANRKHKIELDSLYLKMRNPQHFCPQVKRQDFPHAPCISTQQTEMENQLRNLHPSTFTRRQNTATSNERSNPYGSDTFFR